MEELDQGNVVELDAETLQVLARTTTRGSSPCHVVLVPKSASASVAVANYGSGTAAVFDSLAVRGTGGAEVGSGDAPGDTDDFNNPQLLAHPGKGPVQDRQEASHAHQVTPTPWGSLLVSDLGADRVDEYAPTPGEQFALAGSAAFPPGSGPRHVAIRNGPGVSQGDAPASEGSTAELYVSGELDGRLHKFLRQKSGGEWRWHWDSAIVLGESAGPDDAPSLPSHLELSSKGDLAYIAVRGRNTLVTVDLGAHEAARTSGPMTVLSEVGCGGDWPRHFALAETDQGARMLYMANERSHNLAVFAIDAAGLPSVDPIASFAVGSPTCVVPDFSTPIQPLS
ncbi:MAG: lactonase family protein [Acidobacteria bacterium]|nr:lactonase family protein [Acidobacteriota bacterium]